MPVWGVWLHGRLWFSSANGSRKARNLTVQPWCSVATDDPLEPALGPMSYSAAVSRRASTQTVPPERAATSMALATSATGSAATPAPRA